MKWKRLKSLSLIQYCLDVTARMALAVVSAGEVSDALVQAPKDPAKTKDPAKVDERCMAVWGTEDHDKVTAFAGNICAELMRSTIAGEKLSTRRLPLVKRVVRKYEDAVCRKFLGPVRTICFA